MQLLWGKLLLSPLLLLHDLHQSQEMNNFSWRMLQYLLQSKEKRYCPQGAPSLEQIKTLGGWRSALFREVPYNLTGVKFWHWYVFTFGIIVTAFPLPADLLHVPICFRLFIHHSPALTSTSGTTGVSTELVWDEDTRLPTCATMLEKVSDRP